MPKLTFITELNTVNFYKRIRTNKSSNISHCICVVEFWNQAAKEKKIQYICLDINYAGTVSLFFLYKNIQVLSARFSYRAEKEEECVIGYFAFSFIAFATPLSLKTHLDFGNVFFFFTQLTNQKVTIGTFQILWTGGIPPPPLPHKTQKTEIMSWQWHSPLKIMRDVFKAAKTVWV